MVGIISPKCGDTFMFRLKIDYFLNKIRLYGLSNHIKESGGNMGDDWVMIGSNEDFTKYYNPFSVKMDNQKNTIEVLVKHIFTDKGKTDFLKKFSSIKKQKYIDIHHTVVLYVLDYKIYKYSINKTIYYSKSDNVILYYRDYLDWDDIIPESLDDFMFDKLLQDYNIER